jgi:hypothetical protein
MPSAEHYRRHAACAHSDKAWAGGLVSLAYELEAKAAETEVGSRDAQPAGQPERPASRGK